MVSNSNGTSSSAISFLEKNFKVPYDQRGAGDAGSAIFNLTPEKKIAHNGHPVLRWMMDNIFIRRDPAVNIKMDKEKSTEKIDGSVATVMALDRAIRCGCETADIVYDSREMILL